MNFFEYQDRARSSTRKLVFLFACAVFTLIVITSLLVVVIMSMMMSEGGARPAFERSLLTSDIFLGVGAVVLAVVLLGSFYRMLQLRGGGRAVAEGLGGRLLNVQTRDADERKMLNVVEEMAIASGLSVPQVYLLEDTAINAFAAGYRQQDAVIGVTRGCIAKLSRDELQGVIAHEFSHIFNGDMRLNIRLIGWLYGIMVIGLVGYYLMRSNAFRHNRGRNNKGGVVLLGLGLMVVGYSGTFFGNLIKAGVSRQREFLADASAVQFTRNPEGIGGALKKIGGDSARVTTADTSEISHMLFAQGLKSSLLGLLATHPPIDLRIRRIDPRWDGKFVAAAAGAGVSKSLAAETVTDGSAARRAGLPGTGVLGGMIASIGNPHMENIQAAREQLDSLPEALAAAAHNTLGSCLLMHCLLMAGSERSVAAIQLQYLQQQLNEESFRQLRALQQQVANLDRRHYLMLVDLALPALAQLSAAQFRIFMRDLHQLIQADAQVSLFEWCLYRIIRYSLDRREQRKGHSTDLNHAAAQCQVLLSSLARAGHGTEAAAELAYRAGMDSLQFAERPALSWNGTQDLAALEQAVNRLQHLKPLQKPRLLKAMALCIEHDRVVASAEGELLRAVGAVLDCPIPPLTNSSVVSERSLVSESSLVSE